MTTSKRTLILVISSTLILNAIIVVVWYVNYPKNKIPLPLHISTTSAVVIVGKIEDNHRSIIRKYYADVNYDNCIRLEFGYNFDKFPCRVDVLKFNTVLASYLIATNDTVIKVPRDSISTLQYYIDNRLVWDYYYGYEPRLWNISTTIDLDSTMNQDGSRRKDVRLRSYLSNYPTLNTKNGCY
ncbi:MAG: hypothetical protein JNL32_11130 [Candidatus Kapabacteria bacterium]|nr:hypothetical protein [Candidatus Kapabacteria bacterium]